MSRFSKRRALAGGVSVCALLTSASQAHAAQNCEDLPGTIVYGSGGSAQDPVVAQIAAQAANLASPISIVYAEPSACLGYANLSTPTSITGTAKYWDKGTKTFTNCTLTGPEAAVTVAVTTIGPAVAPAETVVPAWPFALVVAFGVPTVAEPDVTAKTTGVPGNGWPLVSFT